jgi:hypothetical protein
MKGTCCSASTGAAFLEVGSWKLEVGRVCLDKNHSLVLKISGLCVVCIYKYCQTEHVEFLELGGTEVKTASASEFCML